MVGSIVITKTARPLTCQRCSHRWNYTGKNDYIATCAHCGTKVSLHKQLSRAGNKKREGHANQDEPSAFAVTAASVSMHAKKEDG